MRLQRWIQKLFGTEIRPQERRLVLLLTLDVFVLLTAYYVLKVVREPLVLLEGGVVGRNAARGAQAAILLVLVPAYGFLANRVNPRRLVILVYVFFLGTLLVFPVLALLQVRIGTAFFIWLGIFSITTLAQFWSLANDLFTEEDGKRLFPVIAAGGTIGGVFGAQLVAQLSRWLGVMQLVTVAAVLLASCLWITRSVEAEAARAAVRPPRVQTARDRRGGFRLLLSDRYLLLIGVGVVLLNVANTTGDQVMALLIDERAAQLHDREARARLLIAFYANFQTWVSILTACLQVFIVARVLRFLGVTGALLVLPLLVIGGYGFLGLVPFLGFARSFKIVENSADYSAQNTLQQVLFLPTSRDAKFKAKAAIDTFLVRIGDLGSWALVTVALQLGWGAQALSLANVAVGAIWLGAALLLGARYTRLAGPRSARAAAPETAAVPVVEPFAGNALGRSSSGG